MPQLSKTANNKIAPAPFNGEATRTKPAYAGYKCLSLIILLAGLVYPAVAHEVNTSSDVGGTFHIEPNDNPHSGETATAWFALTRKGGKLLPLEQCNCQLAVYPEPHTEGSAPLLKPPLKAISAEQYQGIPGADIVFPKAGVYELELSGTPKAGASFKPFELSYTVTVSPGATVPVQSSATPSPHSEQHSSPQVASPDETAAQNQPSNSWQIPVIVVGVILGIGILWFVVQRLKSKQD